MNYFEYNAQRTSRKPSKAQQWKDWAALQNATRQAGRAAARLLFSATVNAIERAIVTHKRDAK